METSHYTDLTWLPRAPADFRARCRAVLDTAADAGSKIRALASAALDENQLVQLSRVITKIVEAKGSLAPLTPWRLGIVSNATSEFLVPALVGTAARYGIALECVVAGYGQAVQESLSAQSNLSLSAPNGVLVALDWRGLPLRGTLGSPGESQTGVEAGLNYIRSIRDGIARNTNAVCLIQNLAPPPETVFGSLDRMVPGTLRHTIDSLNRAIVDEISGGSGVLLDIAALAETVGLANWHSPGQWHLAKLPFAQGFLPLYAEHVCRTIAALCGKSRRCLVLDLDNTLWGGVIGDDGLTGIQIGQGDAAGEAFAEFQRYILMLRERGVALAVSSKNEDETARLPFQKHPEMLLREEHFAIFQANWNDKPTNIQAIANDLALGLESFVFVDDNPFERELVRKSLPQVAVPEMPADPALYARTLSAAGYFEAVTFSEEDRKRASYYAGNARRAALQKQVGDLEEHLTSLKMQIAFQPFDAIGRPRIAQLISKSNQFNLTTRRYSEAEIAGMEEDPDYFTLQVRLSDIFGDNGMISVAICRRLSGTVWDIDVWLMSCRVLGRRVENMVLRVLLDHARRRNIQTLRGIYRPTDRNKLVESHYRNLGFAFVEQAADGSTVWELDVATADVQTAPMEMRELGFSLEAAHLDNVLAEK